MPGRVSRNAREAQRCAYTAVRTDISSFSVVSCATPIVHRRFSCPTTIRSLEPAVPLCELPENLQVLISTISLQHRALPKPQDSTSADKKGFCVSILRFVRPQQSAHETSHRMSQSSWTRRHMISARLLEYRSR